MVVPDIVRTGSLEVQKIFNVEKRLGESRCDEDVREVRFRTSGSLKFEDITEATAAEDNSAVTDDVIGKS